MHLFRGTTPTQLNQSHVQLLNTMFSNSRKQHCFEDKDKHQRDSRHCCAASAAINDEASDEHDAKWAIQQNRANYLDQNVISACALRQSTCSRFSAGA